MPAVSLRALLAEAIDYAGLFPPADLSFEAALLNQAGYVRSPDRWMLGAFILPIGKFAEARAQLTQFDREHPLQISALGPKTSKAADFRVELETAAKAIKELLAEHEGVAVIRQFEMPLPPSSEVPPSSLSATVKTPGGYVVAEKTWHTFPTERTAEPQTTLRAWATLPRMSWAASR